MSSMQLLVLALATLPLGALLGRFLAGRARGILLLNGMTAGFLGALLLFFLLPAAFGRLGMHALIGILAGLGFITLVEHFGSHHDHNHQPNTDLPAEMVWLGLLLHHLHDGFALTLAGSSMTGDGRLALAVILHRLPVAAIVFHLYSRQGNVSGAWLRLVAMGAATAVGTLFSGVLVSSASLTVIDWFYAFAAGSFLHLLFHDFLQPFRAVQTRRLLLVSALISAGLLFAAHTLDPHHDHTSNGQIHDHEHSGVTADHDHHH